MRVLIAEDDANLRRGIAELLQLEGFDTTLAECGNSAISSFKKEAPDFCILDVAMPGTDGFEVCRHIRATNQYVPILFLTARNEEIDRVLGLGLGADDYMGKPFGTQELIARINAISRRVSSSSCSNYSDKEDVFIMRDLKVDLQALRAFRDDAKISLSPREVSILRLLYTQKGKVVSRDQLYNHCWGQEHFANSRAVDQFISSLRRKIEADSSSPKIIATVHGAGYRFDP